MTSCPMCATELGGLARWCPVCATYTEDMVEGRDHRPSSAALIPDDRLEDEIRLATRRALELMGFVVLDLEQSRRGTRVRKGIADLYVMGFGVGVWVEMKRSSGTQSDDQKAFEADCVSCGIPYLLWRHESEAIAWAEATKRTAA